jgi:L-asparaginase
MKILLLATGGTIASVASEHGFVPGLGAENLLAVCPALKNFEHDVELEDLLCKDSANMAPSDWLLMARCVRRHGDCDAVVLLHGTDTLAWTAAALSYLLHDTSLPVVLTGSMLPPGEPESDAPANLQAAFQFALRLAESGRQGVSLAFAGQLIHGPRATKIDSHRKHAFVSVDYTLLGESNPPPSLPSLTPQAPKLLRQRPWPHEPLFETNVALVPIFPGMRAATLDSWVERAPRAVVLEGFGLGGVPYMGEGLLGSIERGVKAGIPFVLRSQSPFGGTDLSVYEVGRRVLDLGVLSARDMTREALMVKLMLLLPCVETKQLECFLYMNYCDEVV